MEIIEEGLREKEDLIIEAAIRRFSHFGISKTSITEIGNDVGITKQLFSYYFPDKNGLVYSVFKRILHQYTLQLQEIFNQDNISKGLSDMLILRRDFIKAYYLMVVSDGRFDFPNLGKEIIDIKNEFSTLHFKMLKEFIVKGVKSKQLKDLDSANTAQALLQTFHAFDFCLKERTPIPESKDFDENLKLQQNALSLFLQGLNY